jgi:hypothetical protein
LIYELFGKDCGLPVPAAVQKVLDRLHQHPALASYLKSPQRFTMPLVQMWKSKDAIKTWQASLFALDEEEWRNRK